MSDEKAQLAAAIHRACDLLIEHSHHREALNHALAFLDSVNEILAQGTERTVEERLTEFASQMVVPSGAPVVEEGMVFSSFADSPYSGTENAVTPTSVQYRRVGNEVHGDVLLGPSFEGAPGRAHGGTTAAVFDDLMGALQRVTGFSGYTKTLEVDYLGPVPTNDTVHFHTSVIAHDETTFTVEAEATYNSRTVATARAVFTSITPGRFTSPD